MQVGKWLRLLVAVILLTFSLALPALAHEGREVGEYVLTFGWRNEPAFAGLINGPEVYISMHHAHEEATEATEAPDAEQHTDEEVAAHEESFPADIAVELQAEVTFGDQTTTLFLRPAFGETGHYVADLIPSLPGDYTFRVFGTIGETEIDETFSSADGEFSTVEPVTDVMFPVVETDADVRINALEARLAELEAQLAAMQEG